MDYKGEIRKKGNLLLLGRKKPTRVDLTQGPGLILDYMIFTNPGESIDIETVKSLSGWTYRPLRKMRDLVGRVNAWLIFHKITSTGQRKDPPYTFRQKTRKEVSLRACKW